MAPHSKACDVAAVVKVIQSLNELPAGAQQMLTDGLPHSVAESDGFERHAFQVEFVSMVRSTLAAALEASEQRQASSKEVMAAVENDKAVAHQAVAAAVAAESVARDARDKKQDALKAAKEETSAAHDEHKDAESQKTTLEKERAVLRADLSQVTFLIEGSLRMLKEGGWQDVEMRDSSADAVDQYLKTMNAESALVAAASHALACVPDNRAAYDRFTIDTASEFVQNQVTKLEQKLEAGKAMEEDSVAVALGMWALADCAKERQWDATNQLGTAEDELGQAEDSRKLAETDAAEKDKLVSKFLADAALEVEKANQLKAAIEATDRLMAGDYKVDSKVEAADVEMADAQPAHGNPLGVPTPCAA